MRAHKVKERMASVKVVVTPVFLIVSAVLVGGCSDSARVLNDEGTQLIAFCGRKDWVKCINESCPNGFNIIDAPSSHNDFTGTVRCRKVQE